ncbi:MAG: hypothetical protein R2762_21180 [Bryobacteraceae bacterium]
MPFAIAGNRPALLIFCAGALAFFALAQTERPQPERTQTRTRSTQRFRYPEWEVRTVFPREIAPARYRQVEEWELQEAARQGWELVSSTPYALQNEERGPDGRKQIVTQVYPAYVFKRLREPPLRPE